MTMGEGRRRGQNDFSIRMSSSFSKRWVCCVVENLSRVFLSKQSPLLLCVMRVYIVWVKGKKVTFKILQAESFAGTSWVGPTREIVVKLTAWHTFQPLACASHVPFTREPLLANFQPVSCEIALIFITRLILHQLNTKPNAIKSHKIQGTKLKQLQQFCYGIKPT